MNDYIVFLNDKLTGTPVFSIIEQTIEPADPTLNVPIVIKSGTVGEIVAVRYERLLGVMIDVEWKGVAPIAYTILLGYEVIGNWDTDVSPYIIAGDDEKMRLKLAGYAADPGREMEIRFRLAQKYQHALNFVRASIVKLHAVTVDTDDRDEYTEYRGKLDAMKGVLCHLVGPEPLSGIDEKLFMLEAGVR